MTGEAWWEEFCSIAQELTAATAPPVMAVGVSGRGPSALATGSAGSPIRPAIQYGIDCRANEDFAGRGEGDARATFERHPGCRTGDTSAGTDGRFPEVSLIDGRS